MSRDEIKSALRARIVELGQLRDLYRAQSKDRVAREYEVRILEVERTLSLFGK